MKLIENWNDFISTVNSLNIQLIILDLRGVLIEPPRRDNLKNILKDCWGVKEKKFKNVDDLIPSIILDKYRERDDVTDWTMVTLLELREYLSTHNIDITAADFDIALQHIVKEYMYKSVKKVDDQQLKGFISGCQSEGIIISVAVDGLVEREKKVFQKHFPTSYDKINGFFSSDMIGINKLSTNYFKIIVTKYNVNSQRVLVIGNRLDKDIEFAERAGYNSIFVGSPIYSNNYTIRSFKSICPKNSSHVHEEGLVLGRFQPFHLEHLRFVLAALSRVKHLWIGITRPFGSTIHESGGDRTSDKSNPLPFWLRFKCIKKVLDSINVPPEKYSIIAAPLISEKLSSIVPKETIVFSTAVEEWGYKKEKIIKASGLKVHRLKLGSKTISGSDIRYKIANGDCSWKELVPAVIADHFSLEITAFIERTSQND